MRIPRPRLFGCIGAMALSFVLVRYAPVIPGRYLSEAGRMESVAPDPATPVAAGEEAGLSTAEMVARVLAACSGNIETGLGNTAALLDVIEARLKMDPEGTWRDIAAMGEQSAKIRRFAAGLIGRLHGAAVLGPGGSLKKFPELPTAAFLAGCARRGDFSAQVSLIGEWSFRRGPGGFLGRTAALKEFAKEWARFNQTADIPSSRESLPPDVHALLVSGAAEGFERPGDTIRVRPQLTSHEWADQDYSLMATTADGAVENWIPPTREAMRILNALGDPIKALDLVSREENSLLTREIIALSTASGSLPLDKLFRWAETSSATTSQVASIVGGSAPTEVLNWLGSMDNSAINREAAGKLLTAWSGKDPAAAISAFLAHPEIELPSTGYDLALYRLATESGAEIARVYESL